MDQNQALSFINLKVAVQAQTQMSSLHLSNWMRFAALIKLERPLFVAQIFYPKKPKYLQVVQIATAVCKVCKETVFSSVCEELVLGIYKLYVAGKWPRTDLRETFSTFGKWLTLLIVVVNLEESTVSKEKVMVFRCGLQSLATHKSTGHIINDCWFFCGNFLKNVDWLRFVHSISWGILEQAYFKFLS